MSSDESIWRMRVLSTAMPEYVGELIRCKDCKYYSPYKNDNDTFFCANFAINNVAPDDFCSWAKKREEDV